MTAAVETPEHVDDPGVAVIGDDEAGGLGRRLGSRLLRRPGPPVPESMTTAVVVRASLVFSLLSLWVLAYGFAFSGIQEGRNQAVLYSKLRQELAAATAPLGGPITAGTPVLLLDARSAGIRNVVVVEGTSSTDLTNGPGHVTTTPLPGQPGISVLMARSVTFGAPFRYIPGMRHGDLIHVTTGQGEFVYRVDDVRVAGDKQAPFVSGQSRLTLVTATGSGWRNGWAPQVTVFVDATLVTGTIQGYPPGRPTALPNADRPMQGDHSALVPLVLWSQGLLLTSVGIVVGRARWGRWQTWLLAVPMVLACLWGATQSAVALLPNLI
jgi:sortase A